jgi:hypothetical protein
LNESLPNPLERIFAIGRGIDSPAVGNGGRVLGVGKN